MNRVFCLVKQINAKNISRTVKYIKKFGIRGLKRKILSSAIDPLHYNEWFRRHRTGENVLEEQRGKESKFGYRPLISIVVPVYKTPMDKLKKMIDSVIRQTYTNWEICLVDGSGDQGSESYFERKLFLDNMSKCEKRISYKQLAKNHGIAQNTNAGIEMSQGEYIAFLDHDDFLEPDALFQIVDSLQDELAEMIYTDEDKYDEKRKQYVDPNLKSDFNLDLLRSYNYITHFLVIRRTILDRIGFLNEKYDGAQDYDLILRTVENTKAIKHIAKVLYHWRICEGSTAENPDNKQYCYDAGQAALESHLERCGIKACVEQMELPGVYHICYKVEENPLVSIVIPNKDHGDDLKACISSIQNNTTYSNVEFIIVENNSTEVSTFTTYNELQREWNNVRIVTWRGTFNFSAINNFGVSYANGEYLLLLNNDVTMITPNAIEEMLGICMRKEVGIVGGRLLFPNNKVQHAGIVIGFGGFAGHIFVDLPRMDYGYMRRARVNCDYSAVTAACLMVKRQLFDEVGGLSEDLAVALNDVDFCLKIRKKGKLVVYSAFSEWYHFESKSRGYEDTLEKKQRFESEIKIFRTRWKELLCKGDPYYNSNFPIDQAPFTLD